MPIIPTESEVLQQYLTFCGYYWHLHSSVFSLIYNCEGIPVFNMPSRLLHATISAAFLDYFFFQKNQIWCVAFIFNTVNHVLIPAPYNWCCICNLQRYNEFCRIIIFFISAFALISASPTMKFLPYILQYFGSCKPIIIINSTFMLFGNL